MSPDLGGAFLFGVSPSPRAADETRLRLFILFSFQLASSRQEEEAGLLFKEQGLISQDRAGPVKSPRPNLNFRQLPVSAERKDKAYSAQGPWGISSGSCEPGPGWQDVLLT